MAMEVTAVAMEVTAVEVMAVSAVEDFTVKQEKKFCRWTSLVYGFKFWRQKFVFIFCERCRVL